jgi:hypothetical protein
LLKWRGEFRWTDLPMPSKCVIKKTLTYCTCWCSGKCVTWTSLPLRTILDQRKYRSLSFKMQTKKSHDTEESVKTKTGKTEVIDQRSLRRLLYCVDHFSCSLGKKRSYVPTDVIFVESDNGVEFASNKLRRCQLSLPPLVESQWYGYLDTMSSLFNIVRMCNCTVLTFNVIYCMSLSKNTIYSMPHYTVQTQFKVFRLEQRIVTSQSSWKVIMTTIIHET